MLSDKTRVCMWGLDGCSRGRAWRHLEAALGPRVEWVDKLERVSQRDGSQRFELYMEDGVVDQVLASLKWAARRMGWYVRCHRSQGQVAPSGGSATPAPRQQHVRSHIQLCSLNVGTLRGKRGEVGLLAAMEGVDVLALQETRRMSGQWRFRLRGFNSLESLASAREPGRHGLALLVRTDMGLYEVGDESGWWIFARVFGGALASPCIIGTFYRPHDVAAGRAALRGMKKQVRKLRRAYPTDPVIVLGDWNMRRDSVAKQIHKWRHPFAVAPVAGSPQTFTRGRTGDIDHVVVDGEHAGLVTNVMVRRRWDVSDHWPLMARLATRAHKAAPAAGRTRTVLSGIPYRPGPKSAEEVAEQTEQWRAISSHNRWAPLRELLDAEEAEEMERDDGQADMGVRLDHAAGEFTSTSFAVARELGLARETRPRTCKVQPFVSARHRRRVKRRLRAYARLQATQDGAVRDRAEQRYEKARVEARHSARKESRRRWQRMIGKGAALMSEDPRRFWKWAAGMGGWKARASVHGLQPVRGVNGVLLTDADEIGEAWSQHYSRLFADVTGHSQDAGVWADRCEEWDLPDIVEVDGDITMAELYRASLALKNNKAPGEDGITAEWLKKLLPPELASKRGARAMDQEGWEERYEGVGGPSALARVLLGLLNAVWRRQHIPQCWRTALLVSIYKQQGDPLDMNNYRGISLITVPLKLLLKVLATRLERALTDRGLLAREQAGFRPREECAGQAAALLETLQRRSLSGHDTHVLFVDLTKAYDVVPHEALFVKLRQLGVRGRLLDFVRALYGQSWCKVRLAAGESPAFQLRRGLRQGCPMSPIMFDVFINDMPGRPGGPRLERGVTVPGVPVGTEAKLACLMLADDVVALAAGRRRMQRHADHIGVWCERWEMRVGLDKCGVMVVGPRSDELQARLHQRPILLSGQPVPVVDEYKYLGLLFRRDLDLGVMARGRLAKAEKVLGMLRPFLAVESVPLAVRVAVVKAVVLPSLLYGAEVWGMQEQRLRRAQTVLNRTLRVLAGAKERDSSMPCAAMWRELDVAPLHVMAAARRARAVNKYIHLRTWVATLSRHRARLRRRTWLSGAVQWMRRFYRHLLYEREYEMFDGDERVPGRRAYDWIMWHRWDQTECRRSMRASRVYLRHRYSLTSWSRPSAVAVWARHAQPGLGQGLRNLLRCRLGCFWTAERLACRGLIEPRFRDECPCCGALVPEDLKHLLLSCPRWKKKRAKYLSVVLRAADELLYGFRLSRRRRLILLLGGEYRGRRLKGWLPSSTVPDLVTASGPGYRMCFAFRVARFLQRVQRRRVAIIASLRRDDDAGPSLNQGPNG